MEHNKFKLGHRVLVKNRDETMWRKGIYIQPNLHPHTPAPHLVLVEVTDARLQYFPYVWVQECRLDPDAKVFQIGDHVIGRETGIGTISEGTYGGFLDTEKNCHLIFTENGKRVFCTHCSYPFLGKNISFGDVVIAKNWKDERWSSGKFVSLHNNLFYVLFDNETQPRVVDMCIKMTDDK